MSIVQPAMTIVYDEHTPLRAPYSHPSGIMVLNPTDLTSPSPNYTLFLPADSYGDLKVTDQGFQHQRRVGEQKGKLAIIISRAWSSLLDQAKVVESCISSA